MPVGLFNRTSRVLFLIEAFVMFVLVAIVIRFLKSMMGGGCLGNPD
jgi:hypothetical protein